MTTASRRAPEPARPRRAARSPFSADAALWLDWCRHVGARLDAPGRAADAVAWCAAGRASAFAIPSKLRRLDAAGVDRTLGCIETATTREDAHPRLRLHVCHVGEGTGEPIVLACDAAGVVGHVGPHHVGWIAALPVHARGALGVVVLRGTGGGFGSKSRGLNVAFVGVGAALRLAHAAPAPALVISDQHSSGIVRESPGGYHAARSVRRRLPFRLGHVVATPAALATGVDLLALVRRHAAGDWGTVNAHDARVNAHALDHGGRLVSTYDTPAGPVWVITEADRSATTVLRPDDD